MRAEGERDASAVNDLPILKSTLLALPSLSLLSVMVVVPSTVITASSTNPIHAPPPSSFAVLPVMVTFFKVMFLV